MPDLLPIIDAALASAAERADAQLACRPGCHDCCIGVFAITQLDVERLRDGLNAAPAEVDARIRDRAADARSRLSASFPGDPATGQLFTEPEHEAAFADFANDDPCPVLDPATGTCELYAARPIACRTFGPPVRDAEGHLTVCELCFIDASAEEVARCEMAQDWRALEADQILQAEARAGLQRSLPADERSLSYETIIAFALR
jgi:Fe-S-cluster containining protein